MSSCPACGATLAEEASFCEQCGHDLTGGAATSAAAATTAPAVVGRAVPVAPDTAVTGEESPLDVGWTGPVTGPGQAALAAESPRCPACRGTDFTDGYCNQCGAKEPDPRDHFFEEPAQWLGGVCDIGSRKQRNEDAMALHASGAPLSSGVIVVCDGVSNATDSHIASLAAARAARDVLDDPVPRAMGQRDAIVSALTQRLAQSVIAAKGAVLAATPQPPGPTPPSCTFVGAIIDDRLAVVGNVGDSRAYWLPDSPESEPRQLGRDDSFAAEMMSQGMARTEAETGPQAHAITRWLGTDAPDDLTPHTESLDLSEDGWLLLCSDGLWNYCSEATDLRDLVTRTLSGLGEHGHNPRTLAQALTDFANAQGGVDNITVALARVGATAPPRPDAPEQEPSAAPGPSPFDGVPIEDPDSPAVETVGPPAAEAAAVAPPQGEGTFAAAAAPPIGTIPQGATPQHPVTPPPPGGQTAYPHIPPPPTPANPPEQDTDDKDAHGNVQH